MAVPATVTDRESASRASQGEQPPPAFDLIELFFFAYRDFVGDADRLLETLAFGRAHHRVLHFVHRNPGITVNALLDILKITKQSLNRVMKDLTDKRLIEVRTGTDDRRRRLLQVTAEGEMLALDLAHLQAARFGRALAELPPGARGQAEAFLLAMIDPADRPAVLDLIRGPRPRPDPRDADAWNASPREQAA